MLLALALTTLLVLIAVAVSRPQWFVVASVVVAPLNVFRGTLGGSIDGVALPHLDLSLFRVCVVLSAIGLAARLVRDRAARTALRPLRPFAVLGLVAVAWILYEWSRSVWPLGETLGSTAAFCVVAAIVLGAALTLGVVSARTFYGAAAASALLPLGYALVQAAGPGTDLQKYWRAVPIAGARGGELVGGQFRPASFFLDADLLGMFAVATIALADPRTWARRRWERGAAHALRLVALAVVVVTASTPALVVLIAYAVVRYGRPVADAVTRAGRPLTAAAVAGAAVAVALVAAVPASRGDAISHSLDLWSRFPVNGAGLANFGYVVGQLPDHSSARSFPFTVLAEQGIVGLVILGAFFWAPALLLAASPRRAEAAPLVVVLLLGPWLCDFPLALDVSAVWLAAALGLAARDEVLATGVAGAARARGGLDRIGVAQRRARTGLLAAARRAWRDESRPVAGDAVASRRTAVRAAEVLVWVLVIAAVLNFTPALFKAENVEAEPAWRKLLKDIPLLIVIGTAAVGAVRAGWSVARLRAQLPAASPRAWLRWLAPRGAARPEPLRLWQRRLAVSIGVLASFMLVTAPVMRPPVSGLAVSLRYYVVCPVLAFAIAWLLPDRAARRRLVLLLGALGAFEGVVAVLSFLGYPDVTFYQNHILIGGHLYTRGIGTLGNPDNLGLFIGLPIMLLLAGAAQRGPWRWILLTCALLGAAVTYSKGVAIGLVVGTAALLVLTRRERSAVQTRAAFVLTLGIGAALVAVIIHGRSAAVSAETLLGGRDTSWRVAIDAWTSGPDLFMIGGGFGWLVQAVGASGVKQFVVDSMPLTLLLEGGVIGLALFGLMVLCGVQLLLVAARTVRDAATRAFFAYAMFFLPYAFISVNFRIFPPAMFFWMTVGLAIAAAREEAGRV